MAARGEGRRHGVSKKHQETGGGPAEHGNATNGRRGRVGLKGGGKVGEKAVYTAPDGLVVRRSTPMNGSGLRDCRRAFRQTSRRVDWGIDEVRRRVKASVKLVLAVVDTVNASRPAHSCVRLQEACEVDSPRSRLPSLARRAGLPPSRFVIAQRLVESQR